LHLAAVHDEVLVLSAATTTTTLPSNSSLQMKVFRFYSGGCEEFYTPGYDAV
jgi:hypothetical protein